MIERAAAQPPSLFGNFTAVFHKAGFKYGMNYVKLLKERVLLFRDIENLSKNERKFSL